MKARRWMISLWAATASFILLLLLKFFVADVYRCDSGSMRPTLFGGLQRTNGLQDAERVLVLYGRDFEPDRFELVVIRSSDGTKPLVKRVCALPNDTLLIHDGDLLINGERLAPESPRPAPVCVYDDRYLDAERFFEYRRDGSVHREEDQWVVDGGSVAPGSMLLFHPELRDDYLDRRHQRVPGLVEVNDAILRLEFELDEEPGTQRLRFQLIEDGDTFEVVLDAGHGQGASLRLVRRNPRSLQDKGDPLTGAPPRRELELGAVPIRLASQRWYHLEFSNVDNHMLVRCPELDTELRHSYEKNEPWPVPLPRGQRTIGPRVGFGVEAGRARFRSVSILRDLFYTQDGIFGTTPVETLRPSGEGGRVPARNDVRGERGPLCLGPNEYFLLGDNSAASTDSRHFGPIRASELLGRPLAVVWPELRWLRPVVSPGR